MVFVWPIKPIDKKDVNHKTKGTQCIETPPKKHQKTVTDKKHTENFVKLGYAVPEIWEGDRETNRHAHHSKLLTLSACNGRVSDRPSVPSIDSSNGGRRVCF